MAEEWWQVLLRERLPPGAPITFSDDGAGVRAQCGDWDVTSGWGCSWVEITGRGIHGRVTISGGFSDMWDRALAVLAALGAPVVEGPSFAERLGG